MRKQTINALFIAAGFLLLVLALCFFADLPFVVLVFYLLASFLSFVLYFLDKASAKKGNWRTPENKLHLVSLVGGWPGALFAQQLLRHKTVKAEFRLVFWLTVIINIGALIYLLSPYGENHRAQLNGMHVKAPAILQQQPKAIIEWSKE